MNLILDFDGPLVNLFDERSAKSATQSVVSIARSLDIGHKIDDHSTLFLDAWRSLRSTVIDNIQLLELFDQYTHFALERHERHRVNTLTLDPLSIEILSVARTHFDRIAIASNNSQDVISEWLTKNALCLLVDTVCGRTPENPFDSLKPNPFMLTCALRALHIDPASTIFVGDTETDLQCSMRANLRFVGVRTSHSPCATQHNNLRPHLWLESRNELVTFLKQGGVS